MIRNKCHAISNFGFTNPVIVHYEFINKIKLFKMQFGVKNPREITLFTTNFYIVQDIALLIKLVSQELTIYECVGMHLYEKQMDMVS